MGCCQGLNKNNINNNNDIIVMENKNDELLKIKDNTDYQGRQKTDKEEIKKEKSTMDYQNAQKNENQKNPPPKNKTSSKSQVEHFENNLKINKKRIIKKGSQRIQLAMKELKLLSLEEINNNKKYLG